MFKPLAQYLISHLNNSVLDTPVQVGNLPSEVVVHVDLDLTQESEILAGEDKRRREVGCLHVAQELVAQGAEEISLA